MATNPKILNVLVVVLIFYTGLGIHGAVEYAITLTKYDGSELAIGKGTINFPKSWELVLHEGRLVEPSFSEISLTLTSILEVPTSPEFEQVLNMNGDPRDTNPDLKEFYKSVGLTTIEISLSAHAAEANSGQTPLQAWREDERNDWITFIFTKHEFVDAGDGKFVIVSNSLTKTGIRGYPNCKPVSNGCDSKFEMYGYYHPKLKTVELYGEEVKAFLDANAKISSWTVLSYRVVADPKTTDTIMPITNEYKIGTMQSNNGTNLYSVSGKDEADVYLLARYIPNPRRR